jgi:biotin transport system substrate-specific component
MQARTLTSAGATLIDAVLPARRTLQDVALVGAFSLIIGLSAQVALPLPFTPVPLTMQTLAVLLTGMALGKRLGAMALVAYLAAGLAGLPVFAPGAPGIARLLGPTGGYLIGFVFAAALVGFLAERGWDRRVSTTVLAMALGNLVIYAFGVGWLSLFVPATEALNLGMYPFLIGDAVKVALAAAALPGAWALFGRRQAGIRGPDATGSE